MIIDRKMNRFNDILHRNATDKKHREWSEWNIFRPYSYRGYVGRVLKVAESTSQSHTIKYINGSLQKTPKRRKKNNRNR
jgi:hypothetical protein